MTKAEISTIKHLTIDLAKETFDQDFGDYDKNDNEYLQQKERLDGYCEGVKDALKILKTLNTHKKKKG